MKQVVRYSMILALAFLCCGALRAGEEGDFRKAVKRNQVYPFEEFLRKYPNGRFASEARTRLDDLVWKDVTENQYDSRKASDCESYLKRFPDGRHAAEARKLMADLAFAGLKDSQDLERWQGFVDKYAASDHAAAARLVWRNWRPGGTRSGRRLKPATSWTAIAASGSAIRKSPYDGAAARRIDEFEQAGWEAAKAANTLEAYNRFYSGFPSGRRVPEAKEAVQKLLTLVAAAAVGGSASGIEESGKFPLDSFHPDDYERAFRATSEDQRTGPDKESLRLVDSTTGQQVVCVRFPMRPLVTEVKSSIATGMKATIYRLIGEKVALTFMLEADGKTIKGGLVGTGMAIVEGPGGTHAYRLDSPVPSFEDIAIRGLFKK